MSDDTCCYVIAVNLLHRWHCLLLTRWRKLLRLSNWVNWACLLPEYVMYMSSAVSVTLRCKRIASIRVISQPYALQNAASVRWPAACRFYTRPSTTTNTGQCVARCASLSPTFRRSQITLLDDRGNGVRETCLRFPEVEPASIVSPVTVAYILWWFCYGNSDIRPFVRLYGLSHSYTVSKWPGFFISSIGQLTSSLTHDYRGRIGLIRAFCTGGVSHAVFCLLRKAMV